MWLNIVPTSVLCSSHILSSHRKAALVAGSLKFLVSIAGPICTFLRYGFLQGIIVYFFSLMYLISISNKIFGLCSDNVFCQSYKYVKCGCTVSTGDRNSVSKQVKHVASYLRWPHMLADQVRGLSLREIGGGFSKHHRAPSVRFASYAVAKPSMMVQKMQNIKKLRGHRDAVYCGVIPLF